MLEFVGSAFASVFALVDGLFVGLGIWPIVLVTAFVAMLIRFILTPIFGGRSK